MTVNDQSSFRLELSGGKAAQKEARRKLMEELALPAAVKTGDDDLASFSCCRQVTPTAVETCAHPGGTSCIAAAIRGSSVRTQVPVLA